MNTAEELQKLYSMKTDQRQHPLSIIKSEKEVSVNIIKENDENNADELILTQIAGIRNSLSSEAYSTDSTSNLRNLPLLVDHIQKNQNPNVIIEVLIMKSLSKIASRVVYIDVFNKSTIYIATLQITNFRYN